MISVIITTFNEEKTIASLLDDLLQQSILPTEVIIVDAGSRDQTCEILQRYVRKFQEKDVSMRIFIKSGANIAQGRNFGISIAEGPIIAVTDAGCRLDPMWLEKLTKPIQEGVADFVGGFYLPLTSTRFQRALAAVITAPKPGKGFLPSSRSVAFTKSLWEKVGGYPEWLPWGEDTQFNLNCLRLGARYVIVPDAVVYWNMRSNLKDIARQYFRYAYGDGLASRLSKSHLVLQAVYWGSLCSVFLWGLWGLIPIFLCPIVWVVYHQIKYCQTIRLADFPLVYVIALTIQFNRFIGFLWGIIFHKWKRSGG